MEKINKQQLNKLISVMEQYQIKNKLILGICNTEALSDITIVQYNCLIYLIQSIGI